MHCRCTDQHRARLFLNGVCGKSGFTIAMLHIDTAAHDHRRGALPSRIATSAADRTGDIGTKPTPR